MGRAEGTTPSGHPSFARPNTPAAPGNGLKVLHVGHIPAMSTIERPQRLERDRDLLGRWRRELADDLVARPFDPDLLSEEELIEVLRERIERRTTSV